MLFLCDDSIVLPLRIIFGNILSTATYPDIGKFADVITIFKKGDKQSIGNYRPISVLTLCDKIFEKIIFNNLYKHLTTYHLITKNQRNRKQRVVLNGFSSDYFCIDSGVPQGSVLDPLLFLIYINNLEKNIKSNVKFFDDDTMLFSAVNNPAISANELNPDLEVISQWSYQWKMNFNPDLNKQATELLFFFAGKNRPNHPSLFFNESVVLKVKEHKHLGLTLSSKLSFERYVNEKRLTKELESLNIFRKFIPIKTLDQMYKAMFR